MIERVSCMLEHLLPSDILVSIIGQSPMVAVLSVFLMWFVRRDTAIQEKRDREVKDDRNMYRHQTELLITSFERTIKHLQIQLDQCHDRGKAYFEELMRRQ